MPLVGVEPTLPVLQTSALPVELQGHVQLVVGVGLEPTVFSTRVAVLQTAAIAMLGDPTINFGADRRVRTDDLRLGKATHYQLCYIREN